MFDQPFYVAEDTPESRALVDRVCSSSRAENRAAAERLDAIGDLWVLRLRECGEREDWVMDAAEAVAAEVAAALGISQGLASSYLRYDGRCGSGCRSWRGRSSPGISTIGCFRRWCIAPI